MSISNQITGNHQRMLIPRYWLDAIVIVLFLTLFAFQRPYTILCCYLIAVLYLMSRWSYIHISKKALANYLWALSLTFPAVAMFNHGATPLGYLLLSPLLIVFAIQYSNQSISAIKSSLSCAFWFLVILTVSAVFIKGNTITPLEGLIPGTSTNGIPSYFIVLFVALAISSLISTGRIPVGASAATFAIALIGVGRGSIVVGAVLLIFTIGFNLSRSKMRSSNKWFLTLLMMVSTVSFIAYSVDEISILYETAVIGTKFENGLLDEHRGRIIAEYMSKLDGLPLIFGADYSGTSIVARYDGNPHNSYIRVHAFYGIWGVLCVLLPLVFLIAKNADRKLKFPVICLIIFVLIRATTEPIFFPSVLDFFYILYFSIFYHHYQSSYLERY